MSFDFSTLITDRTNADSARAAQLAAKPWADMTEEEQTEWLGTMKGSYKAEDLNRVGEAVAYIAGRLVNVGYNGYYGYQSIVFPVTNWTDADMPTASQLETYLENISTLRAALPVYASTPAVPEDMDGLTVDEANAIEKILLHVERILNTMLKTFVPCGEALCGGDYQ